MECDTPDRDLEAHKRGRSRLMPAPRESLIAPVMDAEVTERTLEAMKCLFDCLHALHLQKSDRLWKPIVKVDDGFKACKAFLQALARASDLLGIRPQSRAYRTQFTKNYRALFPDHHRHYRVDVLEASQEGYSLIYVNGERYDFDRSVIESGVGLKEAWARALQTLHDLSLVDLSASPFWRSELVPVLVGLDSKWASFEEEYILELIQIERKARRYVMDVISLENQLLCLDGAVAALVASGSSDQTGHLHVWQQWQSCRRQYVRKVFRLNGVANYRRKGKADLDLAVLEASENVIKTTEAEPGHLYAAVAHIAVDCISSFNAFRAHISELAQTPERIDPHLCNNHVLVGHLCRLEETWELAHKYLQDPQRLRNVLNLIEFLSTILGTEKATHLWLNEHPSTPSASNSYREVSNRRSSLKTSLAALVGEAHLQTPQSGKDESASHTSHSSQKATSTTECRSRRSSERRDTLEDRVVSCDVGAFLALPRFVCLYYLLDPIHRLHVFRPFLPAVFGEGGEGGEVSLEWPPDDSPTHSSGNASSPPSPHSKCNIAKPSKRLERSASATRSCDTSPRFAPPSSAEIQQTDSWRPSPESHLCAASDAEAASLACNSAPPQLLLPPVQRWPLELCEEEGESATSEVRKMPVDGGGEEGAGLDAGDLFNDLPISRGGDYAESSRDLQILSTGEGSSFLSLSLSASLQDIDAEGARLPQLQYGGGGPVEEAVSDASRPVLSERPRVFPCNSDSDWVLPGAQRNLTAPRPSCTTGREGCSSRLLLCKVPPALRQMVRAWLKAQQWLRSVGLEGAAEPWLCVVARLSDTGDFPVLMKALGGTRVAGFRHYVEALFQAIEAVSMALQRSCAAEWNECLQLLIAGVTHRLSLQSSPTVSRLSTELQDDEDESVRSARPRVARTSFSAHDSTVDTSSDIHMSSVSPSQIQ